jgi:transcriptional regulator with XRE-family HTH domain
MDIQRTIIANIKKWRKQAGLSQEKLARLCQTAPAYIRQIEIGNRCPSVQYLERIARSLNIAPWQLLYEAESGAEEAVEDYALRKKAVKKELLAGLSKAITQEVKAAFERLS